MIIIIIIIIETCAVLSTHSLAPVTGNVKPSPFSSCVTLTFDLGPFNLIFLTRLAAAMDYMCIKFGVDSSSHFPFRADRQTDTHAHTHVKSQTQLITLPRLDDCLHVCLSVFAIICISS